MNDNYKNTNAQELNTDTSVPSKLKLEITTSLELALKLALVILVAVGILIIMTLMGEIPSVIIPGISILLISSFIFFYLIRNVDEYYVLDTDRKALMLSSSTPFWKSYKVIATFDAINEVVANGTYYKPKNRTGFWAYRAEILLKDGKVIPIQDECGDKFSKALERASIFAKISKTHLVTNTPKKHLRPVLVGNKYVFSSKEATIQELASRGLFLFLIAFVIFGVGLTIILFLPS